MDNALNHLPGMDVPLYVLHTEELKNYHIIDDMDYEDVYLPVRADDTEERNKNSETIHVINECAINGNDYQEECNHSTNDYSSSQDFYQYQKHLEHGIEINQYDECQLDLMSILQQSNAPRGLFL